MFGCSFYQSLVQFCSLFHFFGRNFFNNGSATFGSPRIFFHQKYIDQRIEVRSGSQRILHGHHLRTVYGLQLLKHHIIIALFIIELVYQENNRFAQFLGVAEMVLRTYLGTVLPVQQQNGSICNVERRHGSPYKVITTRAVNDIQFLAVPLHMENGGKHRIAVFLLHREVIADCILGSNPAATFYNTTLKEQRFRESGFTRAVIAKEGNVLNFIRLIYFHDILRF